MSMFTPIGQGGRRPGRRSRWRRAVAVLIVVLLLGAFGVGAYWWLFSGGRGDAAGPTRSPTPSTVCTTPTAALPAHLPNPADVKVEVLNGTRRSGLATDTADAMVLAGFDVVAFGNSDTTVDGVAVVEYGKGDLSGAVVLASYLPGAELAKAAGNTGGVVTVTVGKGYQGLATAAEATDNLASVPLPAPSPICR